jgi:sterol desaturase/sphingolipid hydroxylase (fatty acid hydroxylase superfamily)
MPDSTRTLPPAFAAIIVILVLAEAIWSWRRGRGAYSARETASNAVMMVVNQALKPLSVAWTYLVLSQFESLQLFRLPHTGWAFVVTFVVADLAYYWQHRLMHVVPALWTMHHTHHSSPWMNLTTAVRLNWVAKFLSPLFFVPLVLLGLSPEYLGLSLALGLLFQFFLHTEAVGRFGWFEGALLNTPSAHRVHHGSNPRYIDKNFAGVFIVWDRLFGTYEAEVEPVRYGVTSGFVGHNPLAAQLRPLWQYVRGTWRTEKELVGRGGSTGGAGGVQ